MSLTEAAIPIAPQGVAAQASMPPGAALRPVAGFEGTGYVWLAGRIVWVGGADRRGGREGAAHPRNLRQPWHAAPMALDAMRLRAGACRALARLEAGAIAEPRGLLRWLAGQGLPFPLAAALPRFEALRCALADDDFAALAAAAPRVLGLGPGLTPSGDDFLGGVFFALAHAPRAHWAAELPALHAALLRACSQATNPISAALLADGMQGRSYRALHELLAALHTDRWPRVDEALRSLGGIGATSGGDLAAGVLVTLVSTPLAGRSLSSLSSFPSPSSPTRPFSSPVFVAADPRPPTFR